MELYRQVSLFLVNRKRIWNLWIECKHVLICALISLGHFLLLDVVFFKIIQSYFRETINTSTSWLERMGKTAFLRFLRHSHFLFRIEKIEVSTQLLSSCLPRKVWAWAFDSFWGGTGRKVLTSVMNRNDRVRIVWTPDEDGKKGCDLNCT